MASKNNSAKQLVKNMQNHASKLQRAGEYEQAESINSWAKIFKKIGSINISFLPFACLGSFILSCVYSSESISGNVIINGYGGAASWLGVGFFSLGLILGLVYLKSRKK